MPAALAMLLLLSGCGTYRGGGEAIVGARDTETPTYTAAEIDAINARMQCRNAARNMVQMARCDTR